MGKRRFPVAFVSQVESGKRMIKPVCELHDMSCAGKQLYGKYPCHGEKLGCNNCKLAVVKFGIARVENLGENRVEKVKRQITKLITHHQTK
jgi:hypothetical protein